MFATYQLILQCIYRGEIFYTNLDCWTVPNLISSSYFHILLRLPSVSVSNHPAREKGGLRETRKQIEVRKMSRDRNREKDRNKHFSRMVCVCSQFRMLSSRHLIVGLFWLWGLNSKQTTQNHIWIWTPPQLHIDRIPYIVMLYFPFLSAWFFYGNDRWMWYMHTVNTMKWHYSKERERERERWTYILTPCTLCLTQ